MGIEIERKFLVKADTWRVNAVGKHYRQGYLVKGSQVTVRVRIVGEQGFLTIKGKAQNYTRPEYEYPIPLTDAEQMLDLWCYPRVVEKIRYRIPVGDLVWEVDEFLGLNQGLVLAEVELTDPEQSIPLPDWVGPEVSQTAQYYNASLAQYPYKSWPQSATPP
jgi:CYTH domain-containing protein